MLLLLGVWRLGRSLDYMCTPQPYSPEEAGSSALPHLCSPAQIPTTKTLWKEAVGVSQLSQGEVLKTNSGGLRTLDGERRFPKALPWPSGQCPQRPLCVGTMTSLVGDSFCWRASVQRYRMRRETDPAGFTVPAERETESKCTASEEQRDRGVCVGVTLHHPEQVRGAVPNSCLPPSLGRSRC